jgi:hypothetical protein
MKSFVKIISGLSLLAFLSGCEKDDICDTGSQRTPRLIIEFYDDINTSVPKTVSQLLIKSDEVNTGISFTNVSKIEVPLKTNSDFTSYSFTINNESTNPFFPENIDNLNFQYSRKDIYISRGCGFITQFSLLPLQGVQQSNPEGDTINWISNIEVIKSQINNENEVHIKMYY